MFSFYKLSMREMGKKGYCCSLLHKLLMRNNFQIKFLSLTEKSTTEKNRDCKCWKEIVSLYHEGNETVQVLKGHLETLSKSPAKQSHSLDLVACGILNFWCHCSGSQVGKLTASKKWEKIQIYSVVGHQGLNESLLKEIPWKNSS